MKSIWFTLFVTIALSMMSISCSPKKEALTNAKISGSQSSGAISTSSQIKKTLLLQDIDSLFGYGEAESYISRNSEQLIFDSKSIKSMQQWGSEIVDKARLYKVLQWTQGQGIYFLLVQDNIKSEAVVIEAFRVKLKETDNKIVSGNLVDENGHSVSNAWPISDGTKNQDQSISIRQLVLLNSAFHFQTVDAAKYKLGPEE